MWFLTACSSGERSTTPEASLSPAHLLPNPPANRRVIVESPSLIPTVDYHQEWLNWLATQPRDMESYGRVYDPEATPRLAPPHSVNMFIWNEQLPLQVIENTPEFIDTPRMSEPEDISAALAQAECSFEDGNITCAPDSPWQEFGCEYITTLEASDTGLPPGLNLLAQCLTPEIEEEDRSSSLYRVECAFRKDVLTFYRMVMLTV